jgi:hypothetical protein
MLDISMPTKSFSRGQSSRSTPIRVVLQTWEDQFLTVDNLFRSGKVNGLDTPSLLLTWCSQSSFGERRWSWSGCEGGNEGSAREVLRGHFGL